jgi:hypothetical protein
MKIKHKLLSDFQYISPDKKIFVLKSGTILEEYNHKVKGDIIPIDRGIVDANPEFFEVLDWKAELMTFMKANKIPQPAQLGKKLIPFIEEMVLSSVGQSAGTSVDPAKIKELEEKETELFSQGQAIERQKISLASREAILEDREADLDARAKRLNAKEGEHLLDIAALERREQSIKDLVSNLDTRGHELDARENDLNEKERNIGVSALRSSEEIDSKYAEMRAMIDEDMNSVTAREKALESMSKELSERERKVAETESAISEKMEKVAALESDMKAFDLMKAEFEEYKQEVYKLDGEIRQWESLNFKMKRINMPPSALL